MLAGAEQVRHPAIMKPLLVLAAVVLAVVRCSAAPVPSGSPADHLPPEITRLTAFGERADWSPDGRKLIFLSKTFGDVMEMELATREIRIVTAFYPHHGYTRALYLPNGDILLSGPETFDPAHAATARNQCYLSVLDRSRTRQPVPLGIRCNEGPAVSRHRLHIAWTEWSDPPLGTGADAASKMYEADLVYEDGKPRAEHRRLILDGATLPFRGTMETQNFRPPAETELIFSAYSEAGRKCDVAGVDLATGRIRKYTDTPDVYDEPEGIFPDGTATLVECDAQNRQGPGHIDLWKLALDGSGTYTRLTHFSDYPDYKCSNPVVSDDGRYVAFQMGRAGEAAGVGHGLFLLELGKIGVRSP
jgi:dipeptidyl aminopeptidase/acylaminoacyl peptidase